MNFSTFGRYTLETANGKKLEGVAIADTSMPQHRQLGNVQTYLRMRIFADNTVEIFGQFLVVRERMRMVYHSLRCN